MKSESEVGSRKSGGGEDSTAQHASRCAVAADLEFGVLLVGNAAHREFHSAVEMLEHSSKLKIARDIAAALTELDFASPPSLVVIAQSRPGEYSEAQIDALRRAAPLAAFVALLGSWCEGETRSGSPWPGVVRVYWRQWPLRAAPELAALKAGRASTWSLPVTASEEERLLCATLQPLSKQRGLAAIASENRAWADWLAEACRTLGFAVIHADSSQAAQTSGVSAVLWDAGLAAETKTTELVALRASFPVARVIALVDFPRIEHYERLLAAGAAAVLSKPVMLAELASQLAEAGFILTLARKQC